MATTQAQVPKFKHTIKKSTQPTTSQVPANGVDLGKDGKGGSFDKGLISSGDNAVKASGGQDASKKGTGATVDFGYLKKLHNETIECSSINEAK